MKVSTRQYAKSQIKWITHKLLKAIKELPFVESQRGVDILPEPEGDALRNGKGKEKEVLVYLLDATGEKKIQDLYLAYSDSFASITLIDLSKWNENVLKPAQQIMHGTFPSVDHPLKSDLVRCI